MSSWGAANVCEAACGSAMKALSLSATDCEIGINACSCIHSCCGRGAYLCKSVLKLRIVV